MWVQEAIKGIAELLTKETTTLTSANWTADKANFVSGTMKKQRGVTAVNLQLRNNVTFTANTEYNLGTLKVGQNTSNVTVGTIASGSAVIMTSGGAVRTRLFVQLSSGSNLYIQLIIIE